MDEALLQPLRSAHDDRSRVDALLSIREKLQACRTPLTAAQVKPFLSVVAATCNTAADASLTSSLTCLRTLQELVDSSTPDIEPVLSVMLPKVIYCLGHDKLRTHAVAVLATCVNRVRRFDAVRVALFKYGLGATNPALRAVAVGAMPQLLTPVITASLEAGDFLSLLKALAPLLRDRNTATVEATLKTLGFVRNLTNSFDRHVKKLPYGQQQLIVEHGDQIKAYAQRRTTPIAPTGPRHRQSRSLSVSGVHIGNEAQDLSIGGSPSSVSSTAAGGAGAGAGAGHYRSSPGGSGSGSSRRGNNMASVAESGGGGAGDSDDDERFFARGVSIRSTGSSDRRLSVDSNGEELELGCIPKSVLLGLQQEQLEKRLAAVQGFLAAITAVDASVLKSNLAGLFGLAGKFLSDPQYKVASTALQGVELLCARCGSRVRQHMDSFLAALVRQLGASVVVWRKAAMLTFSKLMHAVGATPLLEYLLAATRNPRNAFVREAACRLIVLALLTNSRVRRFEFDPAVLVRSIAPLLHDSQHRVRMCATELFALMAQRTNPELNIAMLLQPEGLDPASHAAIQLSRRLADTSLPLPSVGADGLVEMPSHAQAPDVPETPGSAGSFRGIESLANMTDSELKRAPSSRASSRASRRIPFQMPRRTGSRRDMSRRRLSADGNAAAAAAAPPTHKSTPSSISDNALHIGEDDHKNFDHYRAAIGLPEAEAGYPPSPATGDNASARSVAASHDSAAWSQPSASAASPPQPHYGRRSSNGSYNSSFDGRADGYHHQQQQQQQVHQQYQQQQQQQAAESSYVPSDKRALPGRPSSFRARAQTDSYQELIVRRESQPQAAQPLSARHSRRSSGASEAEAVSQQAYQQQQQQHGQQQHGSGRSLQVAGQAALRRGPIKGRHDLPMAAAGSAASTGAEPGHEPTPPNGAQPRAPMHGRRRQSGSGASMQTDNSSVGSRHARVAVEYTDTFDSTSEDEDEDEDEGRTGAAGSSSSSDDEQENQRIVGASSNSRTPERGGSNLNSRRLQRHEPADGEPDHNSSLYSLLGDKVSDSSAFVRRAPPPASIAVQQQQQQQPNGDGGAPQYAHNGSNRRAASAAPALGGTGSSSIGDSSNSVASNNPSGAFSAATSPTGARSAFAKNLTLLRKNMSRNGSRRTRAASASSRVTRPKDANGAAAGAGAASAAGVSAYGNAGPHATAAAIYSDISGGIRRGISLEDSDDDSSSTPGRHGYSVARPKMAGTKGSMTPVPKSSSSRLFPNGHKDRQGPLSSRAVPKPVFDWDDEAGPTVTSASVLSPPVSNEDRPIRPMSNAQDLYSLPSNGEQSPWSSASIAANAHRASPPRSRRLQNRPPVAAVVVSPSNKSEAIATSPGFEGRKNRKRLVLHSPTSAASASNGPSSLMSPMGAGASQATDDYIMYEDLEDRVKIQHPQKALRDATKGVKAKATEWKAHVDGMNMLRALVKSDTHRGVINQRILKDLVAPLLVLVNSGRSRVSKTALITVGELFLGLKTMMDKVLDTFVPALLRRVATDLQLLAFPADEALSAMSEHCTETRVMSALLACTTQPNPEVRAKSGKYLALVVRRMGPRVSSSSLLDPLVQGSARLLSEGQEEPRIAAKIILAKLRRFGALTEDLMSRVLSRTQAAQVKKALARGVDEDMDLDNLGHGGRATSVSRASSRASTMTPMAGAGGGSFTRRILSTAGTERGARPKHPGGFGSRSIDDDDDDAESKATSPGIASRQGFRTRSRKNHLMATRATAQDSPQNVQFAKLSEDLGSRQWSQRERGLAALTQFVEAEHSFCVAKANDIADRLYQRLGDGNSKVQSAALTSLTAIVPLLGKSMESAVPQILPPLAAMVSGGSKLSGRADQAIGVVVASCDAKAVAPTVANHILHGKGPVKAVMLKHLEPMVAMLADKKPVVIKKYIIPAIFECLHEGKPATRAAVALAARAVASAVGERTLVAAAEKKLSAMDADKVKAMIGAV